MVSVNLVPMNESHLPEVLAIEQSVFESPWNGDMFRQEIYGAFGSVPTVALMGQRVVGYRIAWFIEDEVHLVNIAVERRHQRLGIGTVLLDQLIDEAITRDMLLMTLEVRASNVSAQEFYRGFLFKAVGVRRGYYSDNREDALLMVLDLADFVRRRRMGEGKKSETG
jgi:ribosomal-protein-alanine N-acetyltransferase